MDPSTPVSSRRPGSAAWTARDARARQRETGRPRETYLHNLYGADRTRAYLYRLTVDSTIIDWQCV